MPCLFVDLRRRRDDLLHLDCFAGEKGVGLSGKPLAYKDSTFHRAIPILDNMPHEPKHLFGLPYVDSS